MRATYTSTPNLRPGVRTLPSPVARTSLPRWPSLQAAKRAPIKYSGHTSRVAANLLQIDHYAGGKSMQSVFSANGDLGRCISTAVREAVEKWVTEYRGGKSGEEFIATELRLLEVGMVCRPGQAIYIDVRLKARRHWKSDTYTFVLTTRPSGGVGIMRCF